MIVDGETFACESCIRGHRTRNCQHKDRPLQHIKAKGRPVSQCNHCRSERKNRSAHVKCQCGKRAAEGGSDCGCFSGGKCRCATKKSPKLNETELEGGSELSSPGSTLNTASPALLPVAAAAAASNEFPWSDAAGGTTQASGFPSLDGLAHFDQNAWISNPALAGGGGRGDAGGLNAYHGQVAAAAALPEYNNGNTMIPNYHQHQQHQQQHGPLDVPDFTTAINEWPGLDDDATTELMAMMGDSGNIDINFDANMLHMAGQGGGLDPDFGLDFSSIHNQPSNPQQPGTAAPHHHIRESSHHESDQDGGSCCG